MNSNTTSEDEDEDLIPVIPRVAVLSLLLLLSFTGNILVLVTVLQAKQLRCGILYLLILNIAAFNILESIINITFVLGKSATGSWRYEAAQCSVNSFFMSFICIGSILGLTVLTVHQTLSVMIPEKYDKFKTGKRCFIILVYTWVHSLTFSVPLAGPIDSSSVPFLYVCSFSDTTVLIYSCFTAILCYLLPLVFMFASYVFIIRKAVKDKFTVRAMVTQTTYLDKQSPEPCISREIETTKFSGGMFVTWLILVLPHTVCKYINQFQYNDQIESASVLGQLKYSWFVDQVFLWTRFLYSLILPLLIYFFKKDIWSAFKDMFIFKKNNSIKDISGKPEFIQQISYESKSKKCNDKSDKNKEIIPSSSFQIPVLFATDHALHIQTPDIHDCQKKSDPFYTEMSNSDKLNQLQGKKCDVLGSQINLNRNDDTSDYDSEEEKDPLSISHPVSSQAIRDPSLKQKRSMSQSDIPKVTKSTSPSSSRADSGLDMSNLSKYSSVESNLSKKSADIVVVNSQNTDISNSNKPSDFSHKSKLSNFVVDDDINKLTKTAYIYDSVETEETECNKLNSTNYKYASVQESGVNGDVTSLSHSVKVTVEGSTNTYDKVCSRPARLDPVFPSKSSERLLNRSVQDMKNGKKEKLPELSTPLNKNAQRDVLTETNIQLCSEKSIEKSVKVKNKSKKRNFLSMHAKLDLRRISDSQTSLLGSGYVGSIERDGVSPNSCSNTGFVSDESYNKSHSSKETFVNISENMQDRQ